MSRSERPLSPHLQVYRFQWNMVLSMLHRVTGVALGVGTLLLAWWLIAAAAGPGPFETARGFIASVPGRTILFGFTWALFYHLCNGIRHLIWDIGIGFEPRAARTSGYAVIMAAAALTIISWWAGYVMRDGV